MDETNDSQDVALENNDSELVIEEQPETPEPSAREKELEAEVAKWRRIANKGKKEGKAEKVEPQESKPENKPNELDMGAIAYLNSMVGLKGKDEIALAREYLSNGRDVLDLPENKFFKQDLEALRDAREAQAAVPKGTKRAATSGTTDLDMAVAKFKETGELPSDFDLRRQVVDKAVVEPTKSNNALFGGK